MNTSDKYFQSRFQFDPGRAKVWKAICEHIQPFVKPDGVVLDIGSGYGDFINNIKAGKRIAMDYSPESAAHMREGVVFLQQSVLDKWNFEEESLDAVFSSNFLEHFTDAELDIILANINSTLKKGGKLLLLQPNYYYAYREYWDDYTHKKAFSHTALADFLESKGFRVLQIEKKFLPFSMKSALPKSYWLTKLYLRSPIKLFAKQMFIVAEK